MATLDAARRNALPKRDFAGPDRSYPVEDKAHARAAKSRASEMEHKGRLSPAEKGRIDAKADRVLGEKGTTMDHERPKRVEKREDRKEDSKKGEHVEHHVHHHAHVHHEVHKYEHHGGEHKGAEARKDYMKREMKHVRET